MKLWLLRPTETLKEHDNPWKPWYNKAFGFVIRAETGKEARETAHANAGDENRGEFLGSRIANTINPWLDSKYSTCVKLTYKGNSEIILEDFART